MSINLDAYRPEVIQLYVEGKKTAEQTVEYLNCKHGVDITLRQFKARYGNLKNLQAKEWRAVFQEIRRRKVDGKDSEVRLFGRRLDQSRVNRARRRYGKGTERECSVSTFAGNRLSVRTPTSGSIEPVEADCGERYSDIGHNESQELLVSHDPFANSRSGDLVLASLSGQEIPVEGNCDVLLSLVSVDDHPIDNQQTYRVSHPTVSPSGTNLAKHLQDSFSADLQRVVDFTDGASLSLFSQNTGPIQNAISPACQYNEGIWQHQEQVPYTPHNFLTGSVPLLPRLGSFWASEAVLEIFPELRGTGTFPNDISCQLMKEEGFKTTGMIASWLARMDPALIILRPIASIIEHITSYYHSYLNPIEVTEDTAHQIFALSAYLVSNSFLRTVSARERIIEWAINSGHAGTLSKFLQRCSKVPAARVFITETLKDACSGNLIKYSYSRTFDLFKTHPHEALNLLLVADRRIFPGPLGARLLVYAANANNLTAVQLMIDRGAHVNALSSGYEHGALISWTPLSRAAINGSEELIRFLLQSGALVDKQLPGHNGKKKTVLGLAVEFQNVEAVAALLTEVATADPAQEDSESTELPRSDLNGVDLSPLIKAAEEGREALLKLLLAKSISSDEVLECVLFHAVLHSNVGALATLLTLGVDPNARKYRLSSHDASVSHGGAPSNSDDDTAADEFDDDMCADESDGDIAADESDDELDEEGFDNTNPILLAIGHGLWKVSGSRIIWKKDRSSSGKFCEDIDRGPEIYDQLKYMACLLAKAGARLSLKAIRRRKIRIEVGFCHILSSAGRDVSLIGADALEHEATQGNFYSCASLLDIGIPINSYGSSGLSGLQAAAFEGHLTLIQYFLDRGADINLPASRFRGRTALQAAASGDPELIDYLINAGADITAPPAKVHGEDVLEAVASSSAWKPQDKGRRANFFSKLLKLGAPINRPENWPESRVLHKLVSNGDIECLKVAIQAGARIDGLEPRGGYRLAGKGNWVRKSALQVAACGQREEATRLLLHYGASVNATSGCNGKNTALQYALGAYCPPENRRARSRIVKLLLANGANINSPAGPQDGRTALQAAASCESPDLDLIHFLLERGAEVNAKPSRKGGATALQGAAVNGEIEVARLLLDHGAEINAPASKMGRTAIEGAAENGRLDMVSFLLQMGAMPDKVTGFSKAIHLAEKRDSWEIVDLLKESQDALNAPTASFCGPSTWT